MSFPISLPPGFELEVHLPEGFELEDNSASNEVKPPPGFHLEKPTQSSPPSGLGSTTGLAVGASSAGFSAPVGSTSVAQPAVSPKQAPVRPQQTSSQPKRTNLPTSAQDPSSDQLHLPKDLVRLLPAQSQPQAPSQTTQRDQTTQTPDFFTRGPAGFASRQSKPASTALTRDDSAQSPVAAAVTHEYHRPDNAPLSLPPEGLNAAFAESVTPSPEQAREIRRTLRSWQQNVQPVIQRTMDWYNALQPYYAIKEGGATELAREASGVPTLAPPATPTLEPHTEMQREVTRDIVGPGTTWGTIVREHPVYVDPLQEGEDAQYDYFPGLVNYTGGATETMNTYQVWTGRYLVPSGYTGQGIPIRWRPIELKPGQKPPEDAVKEMVYPESERRKLLAGNAQMVQGTGEFVSTAAAPAAAFNPVPSLIGMGTGYLASETAGGLAHGHVTPEAEELIRQGAFWVPGVVGHLIGAGTGLRTGRIETRAVPIDEDIFNRVIRPRLGADFEREAAAVRQSHNVSSAFQAWQVMNPNTTHLAITQVGGQAAVTGMGSRPAMERFAAQKPKLRAFSAFGGRVRGGLGESPTQYGAEIGIGGTKFGVRIPKDGNGAGSPELPQEITPGIGAKSQLEPSESAQTMVPGSENNKEIPSKSQPLAEQNPTRSAMELLQRYDERVGNRPKPQTPVPAKPPGPDYLSPKKIGQFAANLADLPVAERADAMVQAHQEMTAWMTDRIGKPWMGPDHKLHIVRSPQEAEKLALEFINNQVDLHDQRLAEAQNRPSEATRPYSNVVAQPGGHAQALPSVHPEVDAEHFSQTPADERSIPPAGHNITQDSPAVRGLQEIAKAPGQEPLTERGRFWPQPEKMNPAALEQFKAGNVIAGLPQFSPGQQVILSNGEPGTVAKFLPNLNRVVVRTESGFRTIRPDDLQIPVIEGIDPLSIDFRGGSLTTQTASSSGDLFASPVSDGRAIEGVPEVAEVNAANDELIGTDEIPQSPTQRSDLPTGPSPQVYVGILRGKEVHLQDVRTVRMTYTKRSRKKYGRLRREFNPVRRMWVQDLANNPEQIPDLQQAGITGDELADMKKGRVPEEWAVHHKFPLDDNGTNDFSNLILTHKDPAHYVFTAAQNLRTRGLKPGQSRSIDFPVPDGFVYPPHANMVKIQP